MAGTYADIPGTRFALDQDGTVAKWRNYTTSSAWTDISGSISGCQIVNTTSYLGSVTTANVSSTYFEFVFAFPEARSINGIYFHPGFSSGTSGLTAIVWESSTDTTDGTDGTWSAFTVTFSSFGNHSNLSNVSKPYYRSDIATVALTNIKGIRVRWIGNVNSVMEWRIFVLHMYGSRPSTGVDRLAFWHPTADQAIGVADLDFGDIAQGTVVTKQFRVKNISGSLTANTITVQVSDLLPEYTGTGLQISTDNVTYQSSVNIGNLASGIISSILYVRRSVPGAETTTQRHARLLANAASWS